jgi:hypothetical protein
LTAAPVRRIKCGATDFRLNHPNWGGANSNPTSGSFGLITGKTGERRIQLAAKYMF